jgi:putative glycosyltransferase (TIGR04348 family)
MNIMIITPASPRSRHGNRVTALRWSRLLRQLGHRVRIRQEYTGERCDLLVALHACRSFAAVERFRSTHPGRPIVVALTGTDLYDQIHKDPNGWQALQWAWRLVVLQKLGVEELPPPFRAKARVIMQSCEVPPKARRRRAPRKAVPRKTAPQNKDFQVCVLAHLRAVKDPLRTALAARLLPASSRVRVVHVGAALSPAMADQVRAEVAVNRRFRWLGDLPRWKALRVLARSRLLVLTSLLEGGANVLSEAVAARVPVLCSRIAGSMGILGADYPGFFPVGDTPALAALLDRAETDRKFCQTLKRWCVRLAPLVRPARERDSWRRLLRELREQR